MLRKRISLIALVVTVLLTSFALYFLYSIEVVATSNNSSYSTIDLPESDTAFGGIFYMPHIPDSLPYSRYKLIEDSFSRIKQSIDIKNSSTGGSGFFNSVWGLFEINNRSFSEMPHSTLFMDTNSDPVMKAFIDSMNLLYPHPSEKEMIDRDLEIDKKFQERHKDKFDSARKELEKDKSYYFALNGYELKGYDSKFYIKDNTYNLAYVKWDTTKKTRYDTVTNGHYESKQLKIRYASTTNRILIPVDKRTHTVLSIGMFGFTVITFMVFLYFFFGLPVQVLLNIAKGKAFTEKNINMLKQISWAALVISTLTIAGPYIFRLIFWKMIPGDFVLKPFLNTLVQNLPILFMSLVAFFVAKAFQRGHKLQQYEDLTI